MARQPLWKPRLQSQIEWHAWHRSDRVSSALLSEAQKEDWHINEPGSHQKPHRFERQLLAQSGHSATTVRCPLSGVKRTPLIEVAMSANDPKRTSASGLWC